MVAAYGTSTVMHLGASLVISAIMSAPWPSLAPASIALALSGLAGLVMSVIAIFRAKRQTSYQPVWDDWFWFHILPCVIYAALAFSAIYLRHVSTPDLFVIAGSSFGLLVVGIHNAWDSVVYLIIERGREAKKS